MKINGVVAFITLLLVALSPVTVGAEEIDFSRENLSYRYAVSLRSSKVPIDTSAIPHLKAFKSHLLYTTRLKKGDIMWYRLRLGFFPSKRSAHKVLRSLRGEYPYAWITRVSKRERIESARTAVTFKTPLREVLKRSSSTIRKKIKGLFTPRADDGEGETTPQREAEKPKLKKSEQIEGEEPKPEEKKGAQSRSISQGRLATVMKEAEVEMTKGNYSKAIKLYKRILQTQANPYQQNAREFIGLAYEKRGQIDKAIAEYKGYLLLYPKSEEASRVRQRLAGLETARARPKKRLQKVKKTRREGTEFYGSFSQFYNRDENYTDLGGKSITRSSVSSDLDLNIRKRGSKYDLRSVLIGGYDYNFIDDGEDNEFRLNRFYFDWSDKRRVVTARAGRQSRSVGGVLGRYDGGLLMYSIIPRMKINLVAGFPVESSVLESIDTDKHFYGVSLDLGTFYKHWDGNVFFINQEAEGIIDRQAVGGEIRYFGPHRHFFYLFDYDISYEELNTILFVGNWTLVDKSTVNVTIDYRNSPILTTSNALQGQSAGDLSELMESFSEEEVRNL
ncbi:MAG: tol-pal system YbgF family protein, partial [Thermodesulfobacteriota bacterium]